MAQHYRELIVASRLLLRSEGQRGRLAAARVRRSISTSYYALFHFLLEDCGNRLVGRGSVHLRRRRIGARTFSHLGLRATFQKLAPEVLPPEVSDFLRFDEPAGRIATPAFVRLKAKTFVQAQTQRNLADYDLNRRMTELEAAVLSEEVARSIDGWHYARSKREDDFKDAISLLMLSNGKLRGSDA